MDAQAALVLQQLSEVPGIERAILRERGFEEANHLLGQLVSSLWPRPLWHKPRQTALLEGALRLIERRTGNAERSRCPSNGLPLELNAPQHLVPHLDQILRVEEGIV
jgi:hypothetical protein